MNVAHEYSVLPGTQEWLSLSHAERVASCYVPSDKLSAMTTEALIETSINYPFLVNIFAYSSFEKGVENLSFQFLGLEILTARTDAIQELIHYIEALKSGEKTSTNRIALTACSFLIDYITKKQNPLLGLESNTNTRSTQIQFLTRGGNTVNAIVNKDWGDFGFSDYTIVISDMYAEYAESFPNAQQLSGPSPKYNCHSYAWYRQTLFDSENNLWIDDPTPYLTDYFYVTQTSTPSSGNRFTYGSNDDSHSGIVVSGSGANLMVTSKWGFMGVYSHKIGECPYTHYGNLRYWVVS